MSDGITIDLDKAQTFVCWEHQVVLIAAKGVAGVLRPNGESRYSVSGCETCKTARESAIDLMGDPA